MSNFYVGEVLFETGGTIETPGDINVTAICDCAGSTGTAGQLLSSTGTALEWITAGSAGIPCSILTAKGDIVVALGTANPSALPVGTDGQILYADSASTSGLCWGAAPATPTATPTVFGTIKGCVTSSSISIGCNAFVTGLGPNNVAAGACALCSTTSSGGSNVALGTLALRDLTAGTFNIGVGTQSLLLTTTGCQNVGIGAQAFRSFNGNRSVAIGASAGLTQTAGERNVVIGPDVYLPSITGSCQLAIGYTNGQCWLTGNSTKAIKPGAGIIDCAGSCGTAGQVLSSNGSNAIEWIAPSAGASSATPIVEGIVFALTPGSSDTTGNLGLGYGAGGAITTGVSNTLIGVCSGKSITTGIANVSLGHCALPAVTSGIGNIAIGFCSGASIIDGGGNMAIGGCSQASVTTGGGNIAMGAWSLLSNVTGTGNVAIGNCALSDATGGQNVGIGFDVQVPNPSGSQQLAIGYADGCNWLTGDSTKAIQPGAGIIDCAGSCGTAGQVLMSNGSNAVCWGTAGGGGGGIPDSTLTAKGDLITATAASTPTALGVGTDGQVLTACSTAAEGLAWATPQTSSYITYVTSQVTYTAGTPLLVAVWTGGTMQGTVTLPTAFNAFTNFWDFYMSGDATNLTSGWYQTDSYPVNPADSGYQGSWSVNFPVYPDPNNGQWELYFNPTVNSANPVSFTFFYRLINGIQPVWSI